jgi:ribosome-associated toxin RatA of RatAB toxin-antitoxin module
MKSSGRLWLVLLAFISLASFKKQTTDEWVYEQEKKGIKVFTKKGKWGHLRDSKATMQVSSTPEQMLATLTDFNNYSAWFPRCSKSRMIARLNENEVIVHLYFNAPWPVKDRDCVIRIKTVKDKSTGVITLFETSEPKYIREEDDVVRIQQIQSVWKLTPKNGGTEVLNEYSSNPGGSIPDWMTNTQSVETPIATFENLKEKATANKK